MSEHTVSSGCKPSDCASCTSNCASAGFTFPSVPNPTIKLTLEDDSVMECSVLTTFEAGQLEYIALVPPASARELFGYVLLFRYREVDGQPNIQNIETEEEYAAAAYAYNQFIKNLPHEAEVSKDAE